ncbi:MAG: hypothetical protein ACKOC5_13645 [Chloroflexota bacterium]
MAKIVHAYSLPFIHQAWLPETLARQLAQRGQGCPRLPAEPAVNGQVHWQFEHHGPLPWMEYLYDFRFADLDGDGEIEWLLTCGAHYQAAHCQDGGLLWEYRDESAGFMDLRYDSSFPTLDLDRDGVPELVCPRKRDGALQLCLVDARTGQVRRSVPYPDPGAAGQGRRSSIQAIHLTGTKYPQALVVGWDERSLAAYDSRLNLLWQVSALGDNTPSGRTPFGRTPFAWDIDGDGRDELLWGGQLLDHDGARLWRAGELPGLAAGSVAPAVRLLPLDDGDPYVQPPYLLFSSAATCFDLTGRLQWQHTELLHGQALHTGKLRGDLPGRQVVVYDAASWSNPAAPDRVLALDRHGQTLWEVPVSPPAIQEGGSGLWLGDWDGDGLDEALVNDDGQTRVYDGHGRLVDSFPGHLVYAFDLLGDRRVEAVVLSGDGPGMELRIVSNDARNPHPATNNFVPFRRTSTAMYNCTRY